MRRGLIAIRCDIGSLVRGREPVDQRMLGRQHHVGCAEERVGPGREDADHVGAGVLGPDARAPAGLRPVAGVDREIDLGPLAAADPVALHVLDRARPVDVFEVVEQPLGVGGDAQHPLGQRHADDRVPAALALAVDDFLVRQHGAQLRAPVDRHLGPVGQPFGIAIGIGVVRSRAGSAARRSAGPCPSRARPCQSIHSKSGSYQVS